MRVNTRQLIPRIIPTDRHDLSTDGRTCTPVVEQATLKGIFFFFTFERSRDLLLCFLLGFSASSFHPVFPLSLQGHPPELSDSVKLLLSDAKRHGFEIDQVLKSID